MASPRKPVVCLAFGIINIVLGSLGVLYNLSCACCFGVGYGFFQWLAQNLPPADRPEFEQLWSSATDNIPGLVLVVFILEPLVSLLLDFIQLVGGIGLVRIRNWARWICVVWALLRVMAIALMLFYNIAFMYPGAKTGCGTWTPGKKSKASACVKPANRRCSVKTSALTSPATRCWTISCPF